MTNDRVYLREVERARQAVPQAGRVVRRRRHRRLLVEGRQHDLLQRRRQGDEPASRARRPAEHRPPAHARKGLAVGQPRRRQRRAPDRPMPIRQTPPTTTLCASIDQIATRSAWTQLTDANPQVRGFALGEEEEITWKSKDGTIGRRRAREAGRLSGRRSAIRSSSRSTAARRRPTCSASTAATARRSTPAPATSCSGRTIAARPTTARSTRPTSSATTSRPATRTS